MENRIISVQFLFFRLIHSLPNLSPPVGYVELKVGVTLLF